MLLTLRWPYRIQNLFAVLVVASVPALAAGEHSCIPALTYLPLDAAEVGTDANGTAALGTYERISPDGRFILRSYSGAKLGKVSLMELPPVSGGRIKAYRTPFSNEAFPVQGTWRYLIDVTGEHYRFTDILRQQTRAQPLFKGGMTGFYAAASEMPAQPGGHPVPIRQRPQPVETSSGTPPTASIFIRSLSWPQNADSDSQGVGPLQITTIQVHDDGQTARVVGGTGTQFICQNRQAADGSVYALPMISVDGTEFSAIPQAPSSGTPSMRVYGLSPEAPARQHPCDMRADLGFSPGKAVFGYAPQGGHPAWLTYSDLGHVYVFDRAHQQTFRLGHERHRVMASAFPGLTRDGRVIYAATWRDCADNAQCPEKAGYVIADPYQSRAYQDHWKIRQQTPPKACITQDEVNQERAAFAKRHRLGMGE